MIRSMSAPQRSTYWGLLVLTGVFTLGAILTAIPHAQAPWPNILGYKSLCPFTPGATFLCAFLAGLTCTLRRRLVKRTKASLLVPLVVLVALLGLTGWSTAVWVGEKARFSDGVSAATAP